MSQPWKLLPLAAIVALGLVVLLPGGAISHSPSTAFAALDDATCGTADGHRLGVDIINDDTGQRITVEGTQIQIDPDPQDGTGTRTYTDNGSNDDSATVGRIQQDQACEVTDSGGDPTAYTITLESLPDAYQDCDVDVNQVETVLINNTTVQLVVSNCPELTPTATATTSVTPTPTGTVTPTVGPAATVTVSASPQKISCAGTSIVTIQVRDAGGSPVPPGTVITVTSTLGTISPSAGTTADNSGNGFLFLTGTSGQGGTAVVTAKSGNAQGSTNVTIDCGAAPTATTAPPPTATGGVISPPNTGDAGLASENGSQWGLFVVIGLVATLMMSGIAVKARA